MKLSENFSLDEFTFSQTASRFGIDNTPSESVIKNLQKLSVNVLQPLRDHFNQPVIITSGFRCLPLNSAINGAHHSQHISGQAADLHVVGFNLPTVFLFIQKHLDYDQVVFEFHRWIHVSFNGKKNRHKALTASLVNGRTHYSLFKVSDLV